jgi:hypothetical protein
LDEVPYSAVQLVGGDNVVPSAVTSCSKLEFGTGTKVGVTATAILAPRAAITRIIAAPAHNFHVLLMCALLAEKGFLECSKI